MKNNIPFRRRLFYSLLVVCFFFGSVETILRVHDFNFYFNLPVAALGLPVLDMSKAMRRYNRTIIFDKDLFWRLRPNQSLQVKGVHLKPARINNFGFRGPDFQMPKPSGVYRIICLGDSVTFGWSLEDSETYPAQLQNLLRQKHPGCKMEVINLGTSGYSSFQGRQLFFRFAKNLRPDLVIVGFGQNDRMPAIFSDQEQFEKGSWNRSKLDLFLSQSQVYLLLKCGVILAERAEEGFKFSPQKLAMRVKRKVSPEEYQNNLALLKQECGRSGCDLIILNSDFPSLPVDPVTDTFIKNARQMNLQLPPSWEEWDLLKINRQAADKIQTPLLDLRGLFAESEQEIVSGQLDSEFKKKYRQELGGQVRKYPLGYIMVDGGHPNAWGNRIISDHLDSMIEGLPGFQKFQQNCRSGP